MRKEIEGWESDKIGFSHYGKAGVVIYRFDNADEYFPSILADFIENLNDGENTRISVAEENQEGSFETLIEMNLSNFTEHILNGDDPVEEASTSDESDE